MNAYQIGPQTGLASLTATTRPKLVAGPDEVVLKVRLACLNHRDVLLLSGTYGPTRPEERIPLSEGVGEVIEIGAGVTGIALGDRAVFAHFVTWLDGDFSPRAFGQDYGITHDGWLAQEILVPAAALVVVPEDVSDEHAAPLASSALTAWNAIVEVGKVKAGDVVLALGTGGVAIAALQIAKANGARVVITSSSDDKLALARRLGADFTINYRTTPDWGAEVTKLTGTGADIVVETGGQATLSQSIAAAAVNGRIVIIGALAGQASEAIPNYGTIIGKNLTLRGIAEGSRAMLARLICAIAAKDIKPVIDRIFEFDQAAEAYAYLKSGDHVGKVMIRVS